MVGGKSATYSQEPKLAKKGKLEAKTWSKKATWKLKCNRKLIKKAAKWKPKGSQKGSTGRPKGLRLSIKVLG